MSGYIVQEPEEEKIYYNSSGDEMTEYWILYSPLQKKRFLKVIREIKDNWLNIFNNISFMINNGLSLDESNSIMMKVHKLFLIQYKNKIDYYNEDKLRLRKNKNYIKKKLNKIKNSLQKI